VKLVVDMKISLYRIVDCAALRDSGEPRLFDPAEVYRS